MHCVRKVQIDSLGSLGSLLSTAYAKLLLFPYNCVKIYINIFIFLYNVFTPCKIYLAIYLFIYIYVFLVICRNSARDTSETTAYFWVKTHARVGYISIHSPYSCASHINELRLRSNESEDEIWLKKHWKIGTIHSKDSSRATFFLHCQGTVCMHGI